MQNKQHRKGYIKMKIPKSFVPAKNLEAKVQSLTKKAPKKPEKDIEIYSDWRTIERPILDLDIEPGYLGPEIIYYNESLEMLKKNGYDRHLRPWEALGLITEYYSGNLKGKLRKRAKNLIRSWGEWLSIAVERKGNYLICYMDPENITNVNNKGFVPDGNYLDCSAKYKLKIGNLPSKKWLSFESFNDDFCEFFYTRKFEDLPKKVRKRAEIILPPENWLGVLVRDNKHTGGMFRGPRYFGISYTRWACASRGLK